MEHIDCEFNNFISNMGNYLMFCLSSYQKKKSMCAHPIIGPNLPFCYPFGHACSLLAMTRLDLRNDWACRLDLGLIGQCFLKGMWEIIGECHSQLFLR